ncbi:glycosyltransferase family 2 protein [Flavobacterium humi]|uniref:Glycosyltransferase family 2 protein n=1 Tax=Flavobacterium humi TaxID=2562683 RepID=A0A4Z0L4Y6_9FLAO|nr:glycosyltransferase family 2 protein [Flavobacterium humi]TGD57292.1 glycosyltransferase family 2 protein [Flavobacterium humi]
MKFSIVTITHNRAHLIAETIQSVLDQTHTDFEHIIIDDGSTDNTEAVVKQFNDSRLRYYKYEKRKNRSAVTNRGLHLAGGDFISVLDSDDIWAKDKLETINTIVTKNPAIGFVIHDAAAFPKSDTSDIVFFNYKTGFSGNALPELLQEKILALSTYTIKKETLAEIGFLDESMIDGKLDLYLRAASKVPFYYSAKKLAFIRKHDQNISKKRNMDHYDDYFKSIGKLKKRGIISSVKHAGLSSKMYSKIAYIYHRQKEYRQAKENYRLSFQSMFFCYSGFKSFLMYLKINVIK